MRQAEVDEALTQIRDLIELGDQATTHEMAAERYGQAVRRFEDLDAHMSNGGTLPAQWRTGNPCHI